MGGGDGGGGACSWVGRSKEKERGGSVLCGHGWCVREGGRRKGRGREGGRGREEATDSIEHRKSHKQSSFFWLGSSLSQN